jgi:hypothetical protein
MTKLNYIFERNEVFKMHGLRFSNKEHDFLLFPINSYTVRSKIDYYYRFNSWFDLCNNIQNLMELHD